MNLNTIPFKILPSDDVKHWWVVSFGGPARINYTYIVWSDIIAWSDMGAMSSINPSMMLKLLL